MDRNREELFSSSSSQKQKKTTTQQQGGYSDGGTNQLHLCQEEQQQQRENEYLSAIQASVEAMTIGRETLGEVSRQGEQLQNAELMAEETSYKLDRAAKTLRNMTWSGWFANKLSGKSILDPPTSVASTRSLNPTGETTKGGRVVPLIYDFENDNVVALAAATTCKDFIQAIQNYHCNLNVLSACETEDQSITCEAICEAMFNSAIVELGKLKIQLRQQQMRQEEAQQQQQYQQNSPKQQRSAEEIIPPALVERLELDLKALRSRQMSLSPVQQPPSIASKPTPSPNRATAPASSNTNANNITNSNNIHAHLSATSQQYQRQENHLNLMSRNLSELHGISMNLSEASKGQNEIIDSLHNHADIINEKAKMVTRRAERLIQKKAWSKTKATFVCRVSIRHVQSRMYMMASNGSVILSNEFHPLSCVFTIYKRQGTCIGIKSYSTNKWLGQTLFGSLACSSSVFDRREEWEADSDWEKSRLLCASAGWGTGSYLEVRPDNTIVIGGNPIVNMASAVATNSASTENQPAYWCLEEVAVH